MSILVIKKTRIVYIIITIFCIIFDIIYEKFSYGEYSNFMRFMFIVPLLGLIPFLMKLNISRISYNIWNSAIAIFISGCLVKSIINISGRYLEYEYMYFFIGSIFLFVSIILIVKNNIKYLK